MTSCLLRMMCAFAIWVELPGQVLAETHAAAGDRRAETLSVDDAEPQGPARGLHFNGGLSPYVAALIGIPDTSAIIGMSVVAGAEWVVSSRFELAAVAVLGLGSSPMVNKGFSEGLGQLSARYNWSSLVSSELGLRGGAVGMPVLRRDVSDLPRGTASEYYYRNKFIGALGPYASLIHLRTSASNYDDWVFEVSLWHSLLVPLVDTDGLVLSTGIALTYIKL